MSCSIHSNPPPPPPPPPRIGHYNPSGKPLDEMPDWMAGEQREFEEKLDANKDGYLDNSEMRQWIAPNDDEFFNDEIDHLLNHIDENKASKYLLHTLVFIVLCPCRMTS